VPALTADYHSGTEAERRAPHALRFRWSRGAAPPGRASPAREARLPVCPRHVGGRDVELAISGAAPHRTATAGRGVLRSASSSGLTCAWETAGSEVRILGRIRLGVDVRRRIRRAVSVQYMVPPAYRVRTYVRGTSRRHGDRFRDVWIAAAAWCGRAGHSCHPRVQLIGQQPRRGGVASKVLNTVSSRGVVSKHGCQGCGVL
jgi:hypothetical protein